MGLAFASHPNYLEEIINLYNTAFPPEELIELSVIRELVSKGECEVLALLASGNFIGLAITFHQEEIPLLAYFATIPEVRGQGYGSRTLQLLKERYGELLLEIEHTYNQRSQNQRQRVSRKSFYLKNNLNPAPFTVMCYGVEMELMSTVKRIKFSDYYKIYTSIFGEGETKANIELETILLPETMG